MREGVAVIASSRTAEHCVARSFCRLVVFVHRLSLLLDRAIECRSKIRNACEIVVRNCHVIGKQDFKIFGVNERIILKVPIRTQAYIHTYIHTFIYIYIYIYIHTYVHTYIRSYIYVHTYIYTYVHTYINM